MVGMDAHPRMSRGPTRRWQVMGPVLLFLGILGSAGIVSGGDRKNASPSWDSKRYIGLDEVKPGMEAYCLTDFGEGGIEKFPLKVIDVVRDIDPGRDAILVIGLDDRFKHSGVVAGCSGSPVYIDGRLAGALAFGWTYSKDPLYGVTPIQDMLQVGDQQGPLEPSAGPIQPAVAFDFSKPIDLVEVGRQALKGGLLGASKPKGAAMLPCPLVVSGLPSDASAALASQFESMGFVATPGFSGGQAGEGAPSEFKPGGVLTVPLCTGDIKMNVLGTVTEVRGDKVYGFGHSFLGYGPLDLPMASGKVHTVISNLSRSFKLGTSGDVLGAITMDESTAVVGRVGAKPRMLPLSIKVQRYNEPTPRTYNCQIADNRILTVQIAPSVVEAAALRVGDLPPDNTIEYHGTINMEDGQAIRFVNTATGGLDEPLTELTGALALLMHNPFGGPRIKSIDFDIQVRPKNIASYIWSIDVHNTKVRPGDRLDVDLVVESYLVEKRKHHFTLDVPKDVPPGKYQLMVVGSAEYSAFLKKNAPYRFVASNYQTLVDALNEVLNLNRTKLHCILTLPPSGISLERQELPDLPATKAMILQNDKRAVKAVPYSRWIEKVIDTGTVVSDREVIPITVEEAAH
jgi:hypothetical protein